MTAWNTNMDEAPRDGTPILGIGECAAEIHGPDGEQTVTQISWWLDGKTDFPGYHWMVGVHYAYTVWMKPTAWMPLPPPPDGTEGE